MARELLVLRHAKSSWDDEGLPDRKRPLAKRGRRDAPRVGRWIADSGLVPDRIVSSPAVRARETVELVARELGCDPGAIELDERVYDAGPRELQAVLADCPHDCRRMLLVGHNPGLEDLLDHLAGGLPGPAEGKRLPTATLAHLRLPDDWGALERGAGELLALVRPRDL